MKRKQGLQQFGEGAWSYLKASRGFVLTSFIVFTISVFAGFFGVDYLSFLDALIADIFAKVEGLSGTSLIIFIFYNNVMSSFFALFLGAFFGVFSFFNILLNGTVVGYVIALASETHGIGIVWRLIPHGIFELPAIFISTGLGLKLGMSFFMPNRIKTLKERFMGSVKVFVSIVIPLLIIAAIIEGLLITLSS